MDPITAAIIAAISAGAITGLTETTKTAIADAYTRLKALLVNKFGSESEVVRAVNEVEARPDSAGRKTILQEEVATVEAHKDQDVLHAAQELLKQFSGSSHSEHSSQIAVGSNIGQASGQGNTVSVNVGTPKER